MEKHKFNIFPEMSAEEQILFNARNLGFLALNKETKQVIELIPYSFNEFWAIVVTSGLAQENTTVPVAAELIEPVLIQMGVIFPVEFWAVGKTKLPNWKLYEGGN